MKHHHLFLPCLIAACLGLYPAPSSAAFQEDASSSYDSPPQSPLKKNPPHLRPEDPSSAIETQHAQLFPPPAPQEEDRDSDFVDMEEIDRYLAARDQRRRQSSPQVLPADIEAVSQQLAAQQIRSASESQRADDPESEAPERASQLAAERTSYSYTPPHADQWEKTPDTPFPGRRHGRAPAASDADLPVKFAFLNK
jgi:hypothetical protein